MKINMKNLIFFSKYFKNFKFYSNFYFKQNFNETNKEIKTFS